MGMAGRPQPPPSSTMPGPPRRAGEHLGTTANIYAEHHKLVFASMKGKAKADKI